VTELDLLKKSLEVEKKRFH